MNKERRLTKEKERPVGGWLPHPGVGGGGVGGFLWVFFLLVFGVFFFGFFFVFGWGCVGRRDPSDNTPFVVSARSFRYV